MVSNKEKQIGRRLLEAGVKILEEDEVIKRKGEEILAVKKREEKKYITGPNEEAQENAKKGAAEGEKLMGTGRKNETEGKKLIKEGEILLNKEKDS